MSDNTAAVVIVAILAGAGLAIGIVPALLDLAETWIRSRHRD